MNDYTDVTNVRTPPLGAVPEGPAREAVAEFLDARAKWVEASGRVSALRSADAIDAARAADARAALDAAKAGKDPGTVGSPAQAKLASDAAEAARAEAAYGSMMREAWERAALAIQAAGPEAAAHWRTERDRRARAAREALEVLRTAERQWANATSAVAYWDAATVNPRTNWGGYGVPGLVVGHTNLKPLADSLDAVAAAQDGTNHRQAPEDVPAREAAAPGEYREPKPRKAPKRIRGGE